jgi:Xaa-Pro aminopeptidase
VTTDPTHRRYRHRLEQIREQLSRLGFDGLLILIEENRRYLTGFTGEDGQFNESAGVLIITPDRTLLATDSRYDLQAKGETYGVEVVKYPKGWAVDLPDIVRDMNIRTLGFESARMSVLQHDKLTEGFKRRPPGVKMIPMESVVEPLREIKDDHEVAITRRAVAAAETAFERLLPRIKPGAKESELAWALEEELRCAGAEGSSFPIIVASGPNSSLPHATPGHREIAAGEPILFDWGARIDGYCSDISRTVFIGRADETFSRVFTVVRDAQRKAIDAIRPGASGREMDAIARAHIDGTEFADRFGHSLGHGTGLAIHEGPKLSPISDCVLAAGMIVTVEPGIYIPGWGGVRLENQILVTESGADILNRLPIADGYLNVDT